jgi:hypothetical protein
MTEFDQDCIHHYGEPLKGVFKHYCPEFDYLPIDETCSEWQFCMCEFGEKND